MSAWCPVTQRACERTTCVGAVCQAQSEMSAQSATLLQQGIEDVQEGRFRPVPTDVVPDRLRTAADAIRAELKKWRALYQHYLLHIDKMRQQEDLHGGWDGFANASEVSHYCDALVFALEAMGMAE